MGIFINILVMKKILMMVIFLCVSVICSAPVIDFRLKLGQLNFFPLTADAQKRFHDSEFTRFINNLGYRESGNNWVSVNRIGCFGEWQFAETTLEISWFQKDYPEKFQKESIHLSEGAAGGGIKDADKG